MLLQQFIILNGIYAFKIENAISLSRLDENCP